MSKGGKGILGMLTTGPFKTEKAPGSGGLGFIAGPAAELVASLPKAPKLKTPQAPQPSVMPSVQSARLGQQGTGQAGGAAGVSQTFLTGPSGVDPTALTLGRNQLLGG